METPKKDLVDFLMNSPHLISQEEKTYQTEMLMCMRKGQSECHPLKILLINQVIKWRRYTIFAYSIIFKMETNSIFWVH